MNTTINDGMAWCNGLVSLIVTLNIQALIMRVDNINSYQRNTKYINIIQTITCFTKYNLNNEGQMTVISKLLYMDL